ncbi:hypothetical protein GCM10010330_81310 [Streptomyces tendae]|uniref:hypothetical protein n=1 Tax=Streptomyces tendae TaxID=1932 RepID=UPI001679EB55|nr:hypothetical protein [Streptomyces tendae]GHB15998.1 hypothetical protein GCM10010330_81310 [Streptomyces tendae]
MNAATADGRQARVLAGALRNWAAIDTDETPVAARIQIRQPPEWGFVSTINITDQQTHRLLDLLRDDLAANTPHLASHERGAAVIDDLITQRRTEGHTTLHVRDLVHAAPRIGRPASWIAAHLGDLADAGLIEETWRPGLFRIA